MKRTNGVFQILADQPTSDPRLIQAACDGDIEAVQALIERNA